jgi:hypothetical protein
MNLIIIRVGVRHLYKENIVTWSKNTYEGEWVSKSIERLIIADSHAYSSSRRRERDVERDLWTRSFLVCSLAVC